ncbi:MAG: hypothetical protein AAFQ94_18925 [Bacteroidota bacterium]
MKNKKLIIQLIKQDLKHRKLVSGLAQLGLEDHNTYDLEILEIIEELMQVKDGELSDTFTAVYYSFMQEVIKVDVQELDAHISAIANQCYDMLDALMKIRERVCV